MSNRFGILVIVGLAGLLLLFNVLYIVKEYERGVKLQFGRIVNADLAPGLGFKLPFVNQVHIFDGRLISLNADPQSFLTSEKKGVIVDSYVKWRIDNVSRYFTATSGEIGRANQLLEQRVSAGLRNQFAERTVREVVAGERDQLMANLIDGLNSIVKDEVGIVVIDVRVKRIDLPDQVSESVYQRMRSERQRIAQALRAEGQELAEEIRAEADRQRTVIVAHAYREAEELRGQGDASAGDIYAKAYSRDADFYQFVRSLNAYRDNFSDGRSLLLLSPDSDYLRYLKNASGKSGR